MSLTVLDSAHGADHGYESLPKDGSGTNEQDMGNSESQSVLKMRSLSWSQEPFTALDFKTRRSGTQRSCPECASSCIAAVPADGQAGRIRLPTPIHKRAARRSCMPIKNAAVSVASQAPSASRVPPSQVGSKKSSSASSFVDHPARPGSRRSHFHDPGIG